MLQNKLQTFIDRYEEINDLLISSEITSDIKRMTELSKEQSGMEAIVKKAKEEIEKEKDKVIIELKEQVVNLSILAAEKIIDKSLNDDDHIDIIQDTINEYGLS